MTVLDFAGHQFAPLPDGALYWPARQALLVADLHLEKGSWFARRGQMLPPYDSAATLATLQATISRLQPAEVWCLGDSFHDAAATARMSGATVDTLCAMTRKQPWTWITGNHDPIDPGGVALVGGVVRAEAMVAGVLLRHEADGADPRPEISGHFHPKWRVQVRGRSVSRRCFVASESKLIMPSYGAFTGGLNAAAPAISALVGSGGRAIVATEDRLLHFRICA